MKLGNIIANNLSKPSWSWLRRDDEKRFVVRVDEKLTPFVELESAIRARASGWLEHMVGRIR